MKLFDFKSNVVTKEMELKFKIVTFIALLVGFILSLITSFEIGLLICVGVFVLANIDYFRVWFI